MTDDRPTSANITVSTAQRLSLECSRRHVETGEKWTVDRLINALLDESGKSVVPAVRDRRKKGAK